MVEKPLASPYWRPDRSDYGDIFHGDQSFIWSKNVEFAVEEIVINPEASQILSASGTYLTEPDRLLDYAFLTCHPDMSTAMHVSPFEWTRSTVVSKYPMYYGNQVGRYVTVKGCSTTGKDYGIGSKVTSPIEPWGFFGDKDAKKEIAIANDLLSVGFRSALPVGYLTLNARKLMSQMYSFWPDESSAHFMYDQLQKVISNGDSPAILVRLTGSNVRLWDYIDHGNRQEAIEAFASSGSMPRYLLNKLIWDQDLSGRDIAIMKTHFTKMLERNCKALAELFYTMPEYRKTTIVTTLIQTKDIDASFTNQDFEEVQADDFAVTTTVNYYKQKMAEHFSGFLNKLFPIEKTDELVGQHR